ncbi:hypothetical protein LZ554_004715 [Drepanopeziza brunnea f. sp. 'monogermtubi']|nr:hypothetical protein LZ554_004715 [Drepanopeziza brunnea f. sp. 'monogermtubi']
MKASKAAFALALALAALGGVASHSAFTNLFVDGADQGDGTCVRMRMDPGTATDPISDLESGEMACGFDGTKGVARVCRAKQGSKLGFEFRDVPDHSSPESIDISHKGPCSVYMKRVDSAITNTGVGDGWFKVAFTGYDAATSKWCTETLREKSGIITFPIPNDLAGGYYLVRPELLSLHQADKSPPNPQFYVGCAQIFLESKETKVPSETVSIPGYVNISNPAVLFNIYDPKWPYPEPGPGVYKAGQSPAKTVKRVRKQTEGLLPANAEMTNANWWGVKLDDYHTQNGCWNASTSCYAQVEKCYNSAPPTGSKNCRLWEGKCSGIQKACGQGVFNGPPKYSQTGSLQAGAKNQQRSDLLFVDDRHSSSTDPAHSAGTSFIPSTSTATIYVPVVNDSSGALQAFLSYSNAQSDLSSTPGPSASMSLNSMSSLTMDAGGSLLSTSSVLGNIDKGLTPGTLVTTIFVDHMAPLVVTLTSTTDSGTPISRLPSSAVSSPSSKTSQPGTTPTSLGYTSATSSYLTAPPTLATRPVNSATPGFETPTPGLASSGSPSLSLLNSLPTTLPESAATSRTPDSLDFGGNGVTGFTFTTLAPVPASASASSTSIQSAATLPSSATTYSVTASTDPGNEEASFVGSSSTDTGFPSILSGVITSVTVLTGPAGGLSSPIGLSSTNMGTPGLTFYQISSSIPVMASFSSSYAPMSSPSTMSAHLTSIATDAPVSSTSSYTPSTASVSEPSFSTGTSTPLSPSSQRTSNIPSMTASYSNTAQDSPVSSSSPQTTGPSSATALLAIQSPTTASIPPSTSPSPSMADSSTLTITSNNPTSSPSTSSIPDIEIIPVTADDAPFSAQAQSELAGPTPSSTSATNWSPDATCGGGNNYVCRQSCCSVNGWCGTDHDHCDEQFCQRKWGLCGGEGLRFAGFRASVRVKRMLRRGWRGE